MRVGLYLKAFRQANFLAQKEMAARLDVTREYYARLESSKVAPSVEMLEKISSVIGVEVEDIFRHRNGDRVDPVLQEIYEYVVMMGEKERKEVLSVIRKIAGGGRIYVAAAC